MWGPDAEQIATAIIQGCDTVERGVRATVATAPIVIDFALDQVRVGWPVTAPLPEFVKDGIRSIIMAAVNEAAQTIYDALDFFRLLARSAGRPSVLRAAASTLETDVISPSVAMENSMVDAALAGLSRDYWDSAATDSYQLAFNEQSRAVGTIDELGRALKHALEDLANSIEEFFSELQNAYISFAITVAGLAVAIATAGPTLGIGAIVSLVVSIVSLLLGVYTLVTAFTDSADRNTDMASRLQDADALQWPHSAFAQ